MLSGDPWQESLQARVQRLQNEGFSGPMIIALPDCFTKYGGSQFLDSPAQGQYETYLLKELRDFVESKFNVSGHAIAGKSSGGSGHCFMPCVILECFARPFVTLVTSVFALPTPVSCHFS